MTYAVSGLIQSIDYNGFINTNTPNVNAIWSTGSGNSGYGQPLLSSTASDGIVFSSSWLGLINSIASSANHQGTTIGSYTTSTPGSGNLINYEANLLSNINLINTARLNAVAQGGTTATTATSAVTWSNSMTMTFTVTFSNDNQVRHFFNAGGQFGFQFSHPAGSGININFNSIASSAGTLWYSSPSSGTATLVGTAFNGVTKVGGGGTATVNSNNGFYSIYPTGSNVLLIQYGTSSYYYTNSFLQVSASYNGAGVLTFTCLWDEVPNGLTVSAGSSGTLTVRPPSTTYLTNSWGTPIVTTNIVAS